MKNIIVIYWSGTGNTEKMAEAVTEGAKNSGAEVTLKEVADASVDDVLKADALALGCPSMGCEVLEEEEMEPFVQAIEKENLDGKPVILFGSYDWGDGQWMRDWTERMQKLKVNLVAEAVIIQNTPDEDGVKRCMELGSKLAEK